MIKGKWCKKQTSGKKKQIQNQKKNNKHSYNYTEHFCVDNQSIHKMMNAPLFFAMDETTELYEIIIMMRNQTCQHNTIIGAFMPNELVCAESPSYKNASESEFGYRIRYVYK